MYLRFLFFILIFLFTAGSSFGAPTITRNRSVPSSPSASNSSSVAVESSAPAAAPVIQAQTRSVARSETGELVYLETPADKALKTCKDLQEKTRQEISKFNKVCGSFNPKSRLTCADMITACQKCPEEEEEEFGGIPCVKIHKNSEAQCPYELGEALDQAKEDRKKATEKISNLEDKLADLREKIVTEQNQLATAKGEMDDRRAEIQAESNTAKSTLDESLEEANEKIDRNTQTNIQKVQDEMAKSLKVSHQIENKISDAHRNLRQAKNKIHSRCRGFSNSTLSDYRKRRRAAILNGSFKKHSIMNVMNKNRVSFAKKDASRAQYYYKKCLKDNKTNFKELASNHKEILKRIKQQKKEYLHDINRKKDQASQLNIQATKDKQKSLESYYKKLQALLGKFHNQEKMAMARFKNKEAQITNTLSNLNRQLAQKQAELAETNNKERDQRELSAYLKKHGTPNFKDGKSFGEARSALTDLQIIADAAKANCKCKKENDIVTGLDGAGCDTFLEIFEYEYRGKQRPVSGTGGA